MAWISPESRRLRARNERKLEAIPESIVIRGGTAKEQLYSIIDRGLRLTEKKKKIFFIKIYSWSELFIRPSKENNISLF